MHIETHPFPPVLPEHATVMMSGSFPPTADKRSMAFHYPNYQNDMWRVYGAIFYDDPKHFEVAGEKRFDAARIRAFLVARGIAICPSVRRAILDKHVIVTDGAQIGVDHDHDRDRGFHVSPSGVVVVGKDKVVPRD